MPRVEQRKLDELIQDLSTCPKEYVVSKWIIDVVPALFDGDKELYLKTKLDIASGLMIDTSSVIFVGSSCLGFSMNPNKDFKMFDEESDIDIAIISNHYFNEAWRWLRMQDPSLLNDKEKHSYKAHRNYYIFDGTIATDKILHLLPFGPQWLNVIGKLRNNPVFQNKELNFRLYQDHKSLIDYHVHNLKKNMTKLLDVQPTSITL